MSEQNKIEQIKEDLNPIADEVWEKDVFDVITNQDGKIIAEVLDKDAAQLFAKAPEYITYLLQEIERKDEALRTMAESPDEWYVGRTSMRVYARQALEAL